MKQRATLRAGMLASRLQRVLTDRRIDAVRDGLAVIGLVVLVLIALWGTGTDASSYWSFDLAHPYQRATESLTGPDAFRYAPPFAYLFLPFHALSFSIFRVLWLMVEFGCLAVLVGPRWALALSAIYPVTIELSSGNIHALLALAIYMGFRYPATWTLVLLAKVTPAIGLLWFAIRREWRSLFTALSATAFVAVVSYWFTPDLWRQWIQMLEADVSLNVAPDAPHLAIPLWIRLPTAAVLVGWGARTSRSWTVPLAATVAMPTIWVQSLTVLVAAMGTSVRHRGSRASGDQRPIGALAATCQRWRRV